MALTLSGIHHVTAITGNAPANLEFYTRVLGMRLVKKTVNQDNVSAYHLFYGDEEGNPGTELTFFDWPHAGPNRAGYGEVAATGLRVPSRDALQWWQEHLRNEGVEHDDITEIEGRASLLFHDPEGQHLRLVADDAPGGTPWAKSPIPAEMAIRGLGPVMLSVRDFEPTERILTQILSFRRIGKYEEIVDNSEQSTQVIIFVTGDGANGAGSEVHVRLRPDAPRSHNGIGGVHHVAFRVADDEQHEQWQQHFVQAGLHVTPVIDRFYFKSLYFREPGGVLFELATDGPGFATDEDAAHLGEKLALPPFLEPHRAKIEAGLQPLPSTLV